MRSRKLMLSLMFTSAATTTELGGILKLSKNCLYNSDVFILKCNTILLKTFSLFQVVPWLILEVKED